MLRDTRNWSRSVRRMKLELTLHFRIHIVTVDLPRWYEWAKKIIIYTPSNRSFSVAFLSSPPKPYTMLFIDTYSAGTMFQQTCNSGSNTCGGTLNLFLKNWLTHVVSVLRCTLCFTLSFVWRLQHRYSLNDRTSHY